MVAAASTSRRKGHEFASEQNNSQGLDIPGKTVMSFVFRLKNTLEKVVSASFTMKTFQVNKWVKRFLLRILGSGISQG